MSNDNNVAELQVALDNSKKDAKFYKGIIDRFTRIFNWVWDNLRRLGAQLYKLVIPFFKALGWTVKIFGTALYNGLKILIALLNARAIEIILYILLIVFLIWGIRRGMSMSMRSGGGRGGGGSIWTRWTNNLQSTVNGGLRGFTQFNPDNVPKVTRENHAMGRCNDLTYIESTGQKCVYDGQPAPIVWQIKSSDLAGWPVLPKRLQDKLSNNGKRQSVIIPFVFEANRNRYVPKCSLAKFSDNTSASYLFKDMPNDVCARTMPNRMKFKIQAVSAAKRKASGTHAALYKSKVLDPEKC